MTESRRTRVPIEIRREQILDAALEEFSHKGLHGGSTVTIAKEVGISHPNLFRVFPTKHELFVAVLERVVHTIDQTMLEAGERATDNPLQTMSDQWGVLMDDPNVMFMLLQGYAASDNQAIRDLMETWTLNTFDRISAIPEIDDDLAHDFFSAGMLYMVAAAMGMPARSEGNTLMKRFLDSGL